MKKRTTMTKTHSSSVCENAGFEDSQDQVEFEREWDHVVCHVLFLFLFLGRGKSGRRSSWSFFCD